VQNELVTVFSYCA